MTPRIAACLALLIAGLGASAAPAGASPVVNLGAAGDYTLLAAGGSVNFGVPGSEVIGSAANITGNIGASASIGLGAGTVVHGRADYGTSFSGPSPDSGSALVNAAGWSQIRTDLQNASNALDAMANTSALTSIVGTTTLSSAAGATNVYDLSTFRLDGGTTLTLNGDASSAFVFNIAGFQQNALSGSIVLTGGLTADRVFFNYKDLTGNLFLQIVDALPDTSLKGTFLAPHGFVQIGDGVTLGGFRLLASEIQANVQVVTPPPGAPPTSPVPEPATLAVLGLGAAAVVRRGASRS